MLIWWIWCQTLNCNEFSIFEEKRYDVNGNLVAVIEPEDIIFQPSGKEKTNVYGAFDRPLQEYEAQGLPHGYDDQGRVNSDTHMALITRWGGLRTGSAF